MCAVLQLLTDWDDPPSRDTPFITIPFIRGMSGIQTTGPQTTNVPRSLGFQVHERRRVLFLTAVAELGGKIEWSDHMTLVCTWFSKWATTKIRYRPMRILVGENQDSCAKLYMMETNPPDTIQYCPHFPKKIIKDTRVSMEFSNWLVSWFIIYLRDLQPTYKRVIFYLLSL